MKREINLKLIEPPVVSLRLEGSILGTDRIETPNPTQPVLLPSLEEGLVDLGYICNSEIINMKLTSNESFQGTLNIGDLEIEKYVMGASFESIEEKIKEADIIGITSNHTISSVNVNGLIRYAKKVKPTLKILVGGSDASARPNYYLNAGADAVVKGEGEYNAPHAINALLKNSSLDNISRIFYKKGNDVILTNGILGSDSVDMNSLPLPALDKIDITRFIDTGEGPLVDGASLPLWAYETSRGCKNNCDYCTTPSLRQGYRFMNLEKISELFTFLKNKGVKTLISNEDNPLSRMHVGTNKRDVERRQEILEYAKLIQSTGLAFEWGNGLEIGKLADEKGNPDIQLIDALFHHKRNYDGTFAGTYRCYIPLEKLTDNGISSLRKLRDYKIELDILTAIAETKIPMLNFGVMVGFPDESNQTLEMTRKRVYEIKEMIHKISPDTGLYFNFFMYSPMPGTLNFMKENSRMIADIDKHPEFWSFYSSCINGNNFSAKEMTLLRRELSTEINGEPAMKIYDGQSKFQQNPFK